MIRVVSAVLVIAACTLAEVRVSLDSDHLDGTWILQNQNKSKEVIKYDM